MTKNNVFGWIVAIFGALWIILSPIGYFFPNSGCWILGSVSGLVTLLALFFWNALQKVPATPPHKAVLVFLGKRQKVVLNEGWNILPLYPFLFDFILVKVEKVNRGFQPQEVRTPDNALISVKISTTWKAGINDSPESFIKYLDSGGEEGVSTIFEEMSEDRTKTWARSNREGPATWMEAQGLKDDVHAVLAKSVLGDVLTLIPEKFQGVPTSTWMRYFDNPQSEPTDFDANPNNGWAEKTTDDKGNKKWNWKGLEAKLKGPDYSDADRARLESAIQARKKEVRQLREGTGEFPCTSLGITIIRFTVNEVKVTGQVAEVADLQEKERRQREGEDTELDGVSARIARLRKEHPDMPLDQAARLVQLQQGKLTQQVIEVVGAATGLGQDVIAGFQVQKLPTPASTKDSPAGNPSKPKREKGGRKSYDDMTEEEKKRRSDRILKGLPPDEDDDDDDEDEEDDKK